MQIRIFKSFCVWLVSDYECPIGLRGERREGLFSLLSSFTLMPVSCQVALFVLNVRRRNTPACSNCTDGWRFCCYQSGFRKYWRLLYHFYHNIVLGSTLTGFIMRTNPKSQINKILCLNWRWKGQDNISTEFHNTSFSVMMGQIDNQLGSFFESCQGNSMKGRISVWFWWWN